MGRTMYASTKQSTLRRVVLQIWVDEATVCPSNEVETMAYSDVTNQSKLGDLTI